MHGEQINEAHGSSIQAPETIPYSGYFLTNKKAEMENGYGDSLKMKLLEDLDQQAKYEKAGMSTVYVKYVAEIP